MYIHIYIYIYIYILGRIPFPFWIKPFWLKPFLLKFVIQRAGDSSDTHLGGIQWYTSGVIPVMRIWGDSRCRVSGSRAVGARAF